ncbi:MAG: hypothetical protein K9K33_15905, partial [Desulfarculaceae bacterium]|nr:hypothetical protein [Desulfarculaceae bacterium]
DRFRSVGPLIKPIAAQLKPNDLVATLGDYWHGAAFYSGRRVLVVDNWGELDFGRRLASPAERARWFLRGNQALLERMRGDQRVFVIAENPRFRRFHAFAQKNPKPLPVYPWATKGDKTLFSNYPPK